MTKLLQSIEQFIKLNNIDYDKVTYVELVDEDGDTFAFDPRVNTMSGDKFKNTVDN